MVSHVMVPGKDEDIHPSMGASQPYSLILESVWMWKFSTKSAMVVKELPKKMMLRRKLICLNDTVVCQANYKGSSPAMDTEGIKRIFSRSETTRQLQCTEYFGDGDSKTYSEVEHLYDNVHVGKKECVGHVQKRVGTALWKLKRESKRNGGKGKLTDALIDKLQNYYGIAIRS